MVAMISNNKTDQTPYINFETNTTTSLIAPKPGELHWDLLIATAAGRLIILKYLIFFQLIPIHKNQCLQLKNLFLFLSFLIIIVIAF